MANTIIHSGTGPESVVSEIERCLTQFLEANINNTVCVTVIDTFGIDLRLSFRQQVVRIEDARSRSGQLWTVKIIHKLIFCTSGRPIGQSINSTNIHCGN